MSIDGFRRDLVNVENEGSKGIIARLPARSTLEDAHGTVEQGRG